ncbi:hypothetical protein ScPMuIL_018734 [Solemya velum]
MNTPRESPYGQEDDPKDAVSVARQQSNSVYVHGTNEVLEDEPQASNTKQHKIHTISDTVVDTEYPSSPGSVETADEQHKIETQQLLNDLDDANRRLKEERKRQLGILNLKREQKMINMNEITRRQDQAPAQLKTLLLDETSPGQPIKHPLTVFLICNSSPRQNPKIVLRANAAAYYD